LAEGACWYAARASVPLLSVAVRLAARGHQATEAYVSVRPVEAGPSRRAATSRLADSLHEGLSTIDYELAHADPRKPLAGFARMVVGRRSWDERLDAVGRWRPWAS
jgi:hypothetical protein